ncbi:glycosyltransferase [Klenkia brasiliensis]|uniref:Glycosyltransferase involved in cell wall bisynthesis n=1 Tax=Klenkia brasiliensis TaxID=333142 RepID=A0A1G7MW69_9ACTN|nr:glycosyltransferase [Klenkia brasiliensis]SDF65290.1 Glycosyltransferase involved in cell wall bisynthesis [Klenkia brasiliensis]
MTRRGDGALRIAHVVVTPSFAGTERYVVEVAAAQADRGHRVAVVGGSPDRMRSELPDAVDWLPGATAPAALTSLRRSGRRDVVHSHMAKADFVALAAAPATRGRRFSTRHITAARGYGRAAHLLAPVVRRALHAELAVSDFVAREVETRPDVVLLNGVRPQEPGPEQRRPVVLVAQRLAPEKDTGTALAAFAASGLAAHGWTLVVAGDGPERADLQHRALELGLGGAVEFRGWVEDPADLLACSAVLLSTAPAEPCGLSILEAMAVATPVAAAAAGGPLETVGRAPGAALFPPGDAAAAGAVLARLAGDPAGRAAYGTALRELQRSSFDLAGHVDRLEQVYRA